MRKRKRKRRALLLPVAPLRRSCRSCLLVLPLLPPALMQSQQGLHLLTLLLIQGHLPLLLLQAATALKQSQQGRRPHWPQ